MMRAEINPRQRRTRFGKAHFHPGGQLLKIGLGVVAAADARLIGNDNELEARVVQTSRASRTPGIQSKFSISCTYA